MSRAWVVACLVFAAGCNHNSNRRGGDMGSSGPCDEGSHQCSGELYQVCSNGNWVTQMSCPSDQVCAPTIGCAACLPGASGCMGDQIVSCDGSGNLTQNVQQDCAPDGLTCAVDPSTGMAACVTPCDSKALAHSYTGCVFYAVDLPQFTIPTPLIGTIAADQQFAVAVANPWSVPVNVVVERDDGAPQGTPQIAQVTTTQVPPRGLSTIALPQREVSGYQPGMRNRSLLTTTAYRITTDRPTSVYQFNPINNPDAFSNDASLLIPANALDASYVVLGWPGTGGDVSAGGLTIQTDKRSYITIVATQANTKVRVTPSTEVMGGDNVGPIHAGTAYSLTLNEFDTLNLEGADFATAGATDFSGTRIEADGPVAVWSGVECMTINPDPPIDPMKTCCCDHLEEQIFPRSSLGLDYVVVRSEGRSHSAADPEFFRIMALDDGTMVHTNLPAPDDQFTLNGGQMHEMDVTDDFVVQSTKAVMIGQFQVSQDAAANGAETGDPSFSLVPPVAQHRNEYIFLVPSGYMENWALMSVPTGATILLDGSPLTAGCDHATGGMVGSTAYDAVRCPVPEGSHTLSCAVNFGLMVEGWGPGPVSYGYTGGMEFQSVNHDCGNDGDCPVQEFCSGGTCVPDITIM